MINGKKDIKDEEFEEILKIKYNLIILSINTLKLKRII